MGKALRYIMTICCLLSFTLLWSQEQTDSIISFSAHVEDTETGMELSFANVYVADGVGTLTNMEGDFTINTSADAVLQISYVGYEKVRVEAGKLPKVLKMKPLAHSLNEVVVLPTDYIIRKVEEKLAKDYKKRRNNKGLFFYRQLTTTKNKELAEAFIEAKSAVNLRELVALSGRHGRQTAAGLSRSLIADMNFHHLLGLGPMTEGVDYWAGVSRPLNAQSSNKYIRNQRYDYETKVMKESDDNKIYAITFTPKEKYKNKIILTGTIYVNASSFELLSFDGKMEGLSIDIKKDFVRTVVPIGLELHVKYRHINKFTEVENISYSISSEGLTSNALMFNVDGMNVDMGIQENGKNKKKATLSENMLNDLNDKSFADILARNANIVQRTEEEIETAENETENVLTTHYNIKGNGSQMKWDINLPDNKLGNLTNRLAKIGQILPQEKVYIHMDNTSYFVGDSIWFSAYLRRTNDDQISNISGILYVELLNQDGYLMERKLIDTKNGRGHGSFYINPDWYSGYYELRAYTRWQLNWGVTEMEHSEESKNWFINKELEHRYFRDYEKLYSRVFPVYDQPKKAGQYNENMTLRELSRWQNNEPEKTELKLTLYPEGGELIEGVPYRVAFEAAYTDGQIGYGEISIDNGGNGEPTKVATMHRGRGVFEYTPTKDSGRTVVFTAKNGEKAKAKLPKAGKDGVALRVVRNDSVWDVTVHIAGTARTDTLGISIMHDGRLRYFNELTDTVCHFSIKECDLECGVNQATVFDTNGRVFADRLFFVTRKDLTIPSLTVNGLKNNYEPYDKITIGVSIDKAIAQAAVNKKDKTTGAISLSIRDKDTSNNLYDNASMLAEMLLSSEIKGFIPSPDWYFKKDDEEHRVALDLLMMTQGWRRFDWRKMAVRGEWDLTQPDERTPLVLGDVFKYYPGFFYHPKDFQYIGETYEKDLMEADPDLYELYRKNNGVESVPYEVGSTGLMILSEEEIKNESKINSSVRVHSEFVALGSKKNAVVETNTKGSKFLIALPKHYDPAVLFLAASDSAKWKKGKSYDWIQKMPDNLDKRKFRAKDGEFSLRVDEPYPRFVKPYNYYQQRINYLEDKLDESRYLSDGTRQLAEVRVKAKHKYHRAIVDTIPAFMVDAYEAYNHALDAGMLNSSASSILRAYVGDFGLNKPYTHYSDGDLEKISKDYRIRVIKGANTIRRALEDATLNVDSASLRRNLLNDRVWDDYFSDYDIRETYGNLSAIEKYVIYTDYMPRYHGSSRYYGSNLPYTYIAICPYADDSRRMMYRDRRYILPGVAYPDEFYNPDYSNRKLDEKPKDYRRTLYWNPDLQLDAEGKASVTLWNNARTNKIDVSIEGVVNNGQILNH